MTTQLSALIHSPEIVITPGIFDALGALLVQEAGFSAAYLSGASIAYTRYGKPDIGLVTMTEVAQVLLNIRESIDLPVIVDADTGFGNALNVQRTVALFERNGAAAIQLEDQVFPKRCGHLQGKSVIPQNEMVGKLHAALDARQNPQTLIVARTDALAVEGLDAALARGNAYVECGVDVLFIEAPRNRQDMQSIVEQLGSDIPLMANMVEGGNTPSLDASELQAIGYSLVIFPGGLVRAFAHMARVYFRNLKNNGSNDAFRDRMLDFDQLNELLDTRLLLQHGQYYESLHNLKGKKIDHG